ncbi:DNA-directed RNA polymerase subunit omega [Membranicola marinus]|uniref:DNA-directed RNA polymerase subunit omega n=1 Tax=Membranihabitans marinus TaxID=1227546 RepID=A0A953HL04_9BACT|nr:DNA-directed RNA polymerase subunit omega [Membranihabitans marinus]MBY5957592.1 DNA-directed RNA polymerase subunit omega [Membranihabitans marinus]
MSDIRSRVQHIEPSIEPIDVKELVKNTGNIYESLVIISKRANQLTHGIKHELREKLEEFAITSDTIEEIQENKEQIEISKYYEKLPNPAIIGTKEYVNNELQVTAFGEPSEADE